MRQSYSQYLSLFLKAFFYCWTNSHFYCCSVLPWNLSTTFLHNSRIFRGIFLEPFWPFWFLPIWTPEYTIQPVHKQTLNDISILSHPIKHHYWMYRFFDVKRISLELQFFLSHRLTNTVTYIYCSLFKHCKQVCHEVGTPVYEYG